MDQGLTAGEQVADTGRWLTMEGDTVGRGGLLPMGRGLRLPEPGILPDPSHSPQSCQDCSKKKNGIPSLYRFPCSKVSTGSMLLMDKVLLYTSNSDGSPNTSREGVKIGFWEGEGRRRGKKSLPFECFKHSCAFSTETDMQWACGIEISWAGATRKIVSAKAPGGGGR